MRSSARKSVWFVCVIAVTVGVAGVLAQEKAKAPKKKAPKARQVASAFFCPKCSAEGVKALYPKRGKCPGCEERLADGRLIWYCSECEKLNFRSAKCTECGKESKPVVVRWSCTKCEWAGAAPRKQCPKCKNETKHASLDNLTKYICPKCKYMSAEAGECPGCKTQLEPKKSASPVRKIEIE